MNVTQEEVISILADADVTADISTLAGDTPLSKAGIDSLEMMDVLLKIEEKYSIKIPDEDIDGLSTINNIVSYLQGL